MNRKITVRELFDALTEAGIQIDPTAYAIEIEGDLTLDEPVRVTVHMRGDERATKALTDLLDAA